MIYRVKSYAKVSTLKGLYDTIIYQIHAYLTEQPQRNDCIVNKMAKSIIMIIIWKLILMFVNITLKPTCIITAIRGPG